ncbi:MAG: hypothetical protein U0531_20860 [Dehalococcoidia bacterium]
MRDGHGMCRLLRSQAPRLGAVAPSQLLRRDSQRAEYLADDLSARTAGWDEAPSSPARAGLCAVFHEVVPHCALGGAKGPLFNELRRRFVAPSEEEAAHIIGRFRPADPRLDMTHPPTPYRIDLVRSLGSRPPRVTLLDEGSARIDAELRPFEPAMERRVLDAHQRSLKRPYPWWRVRLTRRRRPDGAHRRRRSPWRDCPPCSF